jgi:hypothetical protein
MIGVLGMHRSGTSALSGILHYLGCDLPRHTLQADDSNPKGHFESSAIYKFNDRMLEEMGSRWDDWRWVDPAWFKSPIGESFLNQARDLLIGEFGEAPLSVFKDPRNCRLLPIWQPAVAAAGFTFVSILTHRNPLEVAKSLKSRNGIDLSEGMIIWLRYVINAEYHTRDQARVFTSYDQILKDWPTQIVRFQKGLGVTFPNFQNHSSTQIEEFLSPELRHFSEVPEKVINNPVMSDWVRKTYAVLERWAAHGEKKSDYKILDKIRRELDTATPIFSQLIQKEHATTRKLTARTKDLEEQIAGLKDRAQSETAELEMRIKQLSQEQSTHEQKYNQQYNARAKAQRAMEKSEEELKALQAEFSSLTETVAEREKALADKKKASKQTARALQASQEEVRVLQAEFSRLTETVAAREKALADRKKASKQTARALQASQEEVNVLQAELSRLTETVAAREKALADARKTGQETAQTLQAGQQDIEALREQLAQHETQLAKAQEQLREHSAEKEETRHKHERLQEDLSKSEDRIAELEEELNDLRNTLSQTESALAQRRVEASDTLDRAKRAEEELKALTDENARLEGEAQRRTYDHEVAREHIRKLEIGAEARIKSLLTTTQALHAEREKWIGFAGELYHEMTGEKISFPDGSESDAGARQNAVIAEVLETVTSSWRDTQHQLSQAAAAIAARDQAEREIETLQIDLETRARQLEEQTRQYTEAARTAEMERQEATAAIAARDQAEQEIEALRVEIETRAQQLEERTEQYTEAARILEMERQEAAAAIAARDQATREIETLQTAGQVRIRELGDLAKILTKIQVRNRELEGIARHGADSEAALRSKEAELQRVIEQNQSQILQRDAQHIQRETAQQIQIEELQARLDAIHNSTSWRLMKPLRRLFDVLRGNGQTVARDQR